MSSPAANSTILLSPSTPPSRKKSQKLAPAPTPVDPRSLQELRELVATLREIGICRYQYGPLHLEIGVVPPTPSVPGAEEPSVVAPTPLGSVTQELSDEDMLFYSSDTFETKEST